MLFFFKISSVKYGIKYITLEKLKEYLHLDLQLESYLIVSDSEKTGKSFLSQFEPSGAVFF